MSTRWIPTNATAVEIEDVQAVVYITEHIDRDGKEKLAAVAYSGKRNKPDWNYAFKSEERLDQHVQDWLSKLRSHATRMAERRGRDKEARSRPNPFHLGDILDYSWGYDQTNVEFFQVIEVKVKSIVIRRIAAHQELDQGIGPMSGHVTPVKDRFLSDSQPATKLVQWSSWNSEPRPYVSMDYGSADLWNGKPQSNSWYA